MMKFAMLSLAVLLTSFGIVDTLQANQSVNNSDQESLVGCRRSKDTQTTDQDKNTSRV
ncbi:hypothetical protein ACQFX9_11275 [Aliinostoc sp. HNIBRCY26]|uniref:hypothetical protein n=1 Tax=Aliinostoc sp. HNIBRCY26 TaxID=3418997 RepID=UPI003D060555